MDKQVMAKIAEKASDLLLGLESDEFAVLNGGIKQMQKDLHLALAPYHDSLDAEGDCRDRVC